MTSGKKNNDFGLAFGAEYYIYEGFFAEVKYNLGLTNLFTSKTTDFVNPINNTDASIYRNEKVKNRIFQIGIGYKF